MRSLFFYSLVISLLILTSCTNERYKTVLKKDQNGYKYEIVTNDPAKTRVYTLENGLKVYLSVNKDEPRISTQIAVRAGSLNEPKELSGLSHYFEHLLFKGTDEIGTLDWGKEKVLIDSIAMLFELHRNATSLARKKSIYKQIDKLSYRASEFAIPNEFDRLSATIGANGTNAGTSYEYTIFINEIPSNELDRWLNMELERFTDPVLRLFHTELETVYEEFNMMQDKDDRRLQAELMAATFKNHPLGNNIIGNPYDLKNPSMYGIMKFFNTWYVPNNMAILMSGDLNPESAIKKIDATFGTLASKPIPELVHPQEKPIVEPSIKTIYGHDMEMFNMVYRFEGRNSDDRLLVTMIDMMLNNTFAGLIDLNLVQQQKVLFAGCTPTFFNDYGMHFFYGVPRKGQSLEETRALVEAEIEKIKKGEFELWLMKAVVNDLRLHQIKLLESTKRMRFYLKSFVAGNSLADELSFLDRMERITKAEVIAFAREHYKDNYVVVNKVNGEPKNVVKVEKPEITPLVINRDAQSEYLKKFRKQTIKPLQPEYLDFDSAIGRNVIKEGMELKYLKNESNDLFTLMYITEIGKEQDPELALAMAYLPYLGTDIYSPDEVRKEFYRLGISLKTSVVEDMSIISIVGLERSLHAGIELLEHLIKHAIKDDEAYKSLIEGVLKDRENRKKSPYFIRSAMENYGKYGEESAFRNILSKKELEEIRPDKLIDRIKNLSAYKHTIFYYGSKTPFEISRLIKTVHKVPDVLMDVPIAPKYKTKDFAKPRILFLNYPKSQVEILFLAKDKIFDTKTMITSSVFNEYYGDNMSSVVFQEIRESKALAYKAGATYSVPRKADEEFFISGLILTQADKMRDAIDSMTSLLENMVVSENAYKIACDNIIKNIQSERIVKQEIFWTCMANKRLGISEDWRRDKFKAAQTLTLDDMQAFFNNHIKGKKYTYLIIGDRATINMKTLESIAPVEELSLEQIFNF